MNNEKVSVKVTCGHCRSSFKVDNENYFGETSVCPKCKSELYIPYPEPEDMGVMNNSNFADTKGYEAKTRCKFCKEIIIAGAIKCKHCGEMLDGRKKVNTELLGFTGLLLPACSSLAAFAWISQMRLIDNPSSTLMLIASGTVIATAFLFAIEARLLGIGSKKKESGPLGWFLFCSLFWVIGFPTYLYWRSKHGMKNLVVGGIFVMFIFVGIIGFLGYAIEESKSNMRAKIERNQSELREIMNTYKNYERGRN